MFIEKARNVQRAGGIGVITIDNVPHTSSKTSPMFAMSGDGHDNVDIPISIQINFEGLRNFHFRSPDPCSLQDLTDNLNVGRVFGIDGLGQAWHHIP